MDGARYERRELTERKWLYKEIDKYRNIFALIFFCVVS